jgi:hypothetical protein
MVTGSVFTRGMRMNLSLINTIAHEFNNFYFKV